MGTNKNSKNILISHDITSQKKKGEREKNEKPEKNK